MRFVKKTLILAASLVAAGISIPSSATVVAQGAFAIRSLDIPTFISPSGDASCYYVCGPGAFANIKAGWGGSNFRSAEYEPFSIHHSDTFERQLRFPPGYIAGPGEAPGFEELGSANAYAKAEILGSATIGSFGVRSQIPRDMPTPSWNATSTSMYVSPSHGPVSHVFSYPKENGEWGESYEITYDPLREAGFVLAEGETTRIQMSFWMRLASDEIFASNYGSSSAEVSMHGSLFGPNGGAIKEISLWSQLGGIYITNGLDCTETKTQKSFMEVSCSTIVTLDQPGVYGFFMESSSSVEPSQLVANSRLNFAANPTIFAPVPEPASVMLVAGGLTLLIAITRRRRRSRLQRLA